MSRQETFQEVPYPGRDFAGFPAQKTTATRRKFRAHRVVRGAWFFASEPTEKDAGRFNLANPHGTCYLADSVTVAVRERFGPSYAALGMVPNWAAEEFHVTEVDLNAGLRFADVAAKTADQFGVTRELCTMDKYDVPRRWAAMFTALGFDGIRCPARFSTGYKPDAWALFGEAGAQTWPTYNVTDGVTASEMCGFTVYSTPRTGMGLSVSLPTGVTP